MPKLNAQKDKLYKLCGRYCEFMRMFSTMYSVSIAALQNIEELLMEVKMNYLDQAAQQNFLWQMER